MTVIEHGEIDLGALMEESPSLKAAWVELKDAMDETEWCTCTSEQQRPYYWQQDDGCHGWDCSRCLKLIQIG